MPWTKRAAPRTQTLSARPKAKLAKAVNATPPRAALRGPRREAATPLGTEAVSTPAPKAAKRTPAAVFERSYRLAKWGKSGARAVKNVMSTATIVLRSRLSRRIVRRYQADCPQPRRRDSIVAKRGPNGGDRGKRPRPSCFRAFLGSVLVDVQVDPDQDQRPKDSREQCGADLLQVVEIRPIVVGGRDYRPDNEVHEQHDADAGPASCGCRCVISHSFRSPPFIRLAPSYPILKSENGGVSLHAGGLLPFDDHELVRVLVAEEEEQRRRSVPAQQARRRRRRPVPSTRPDRRGGRPTRARCPTCVRSGLASPA